MNRDMRIFIDLLMFTVALLGAIVSANKGEVAWVVVFCTYLNWSRDNLLSWDDDERDRQ